jgi:hypothetical protein
MFVDFGMAARYGGVCYLRYDDTNPNAEKQVGPRGARGGTALATGRGTLRRQIALS